MAVTTILFKRGNSPISQANLRPGEPGWTLDTGKLYIGIETEHGVESKLINVLDEQDVTELLARIASIEGAIGNIIEGAIGNMHSQVYDTDNDGIVDISAVAQSLSEDSVLDGGDW